MNTARPPHFRQAQLASFQLRSLLPAAVFMLSATLALVGCIQPKRLSDMSDPQRVPECQFIQVESVSVTQQDALPGVHSNVRKQRTYRLEVKVSGDQADQWMGILDQTGNWDLWVDSVAVPVRFRPMQKERHMMFSGMRIFYDPSHPGGMSLPVETYALHGAALNGSSRLVGYNELQCYAIELDTISSRPIIVYP